MRFSEIPIERYAAWVIVAAGGLLLLQSWLFPLFFAALPFLIAWGMAYVARPLALRLHRYTRVPRGVLCVGVVFLSVLLLCLGLFFGLRQAMLELLAFGERLTADGVWVDDLLARLSPLWEGALARFPILNELGGQEVFQPWLARAGERLGEYALGIGGQILSALPMWLIFLPVCLVAAFYFALDLDGIHRKLLALLPARVRGVLVRFKEGAWYTAVGYLRAYLLLMLITFAMLAVGFLLLGVRYAVLLALLFAFLDFLPVLGVAVLLLPWGAFSLLSGQYFLGVGLCILCAAIALVRQVVEPRIVGRRFGLHPLLALAVMYGGLRLFGFLGMLLAPMIAAVVRHMLQDRAEEGATPEGRGAALKRADAARGKEGAALKRARITPRGEGGAQGREGGPLTR